MCAPSWLRTAQADEQLDRPDRPTDQRDRARRRQLYASSRSRSSFHYIDMGLGWHSVPLVCRSVIETWNDPVGSLAHLASLVSTRANTIQPMFQQREQAPAGTSCPMCIAGPARSPTMNRSAIIGACPALPFPLWRIMARHLLCSRHWKILNVFQRVRLRFFGACSRASAYPSFVSSRMAMSDRRLRMAPGEGRNHYRHMLCMLVPPW